MNGFPRLFSRFILRAMVREKVRATVSVIGITLGVAVIVAIRMANQSVTESFRVAVESVSGQTSLSITGVTGRLDESRLEDASWLRQFGTVSPVVETYAMTTTSPPVNADFQSGARQGELLHVLGVDVLVDLPIREYQLLRTSKENRSPTPRELLLLLTDPNAVILTEEFARRYGKDVDDEIELVFGSSPKRLIIRGLLVDDGPAGALGGNFALMDIAAAQWACDRLGLLDRVDIRLVDGLDPDATIGEIEQRLPAGLVVTRPEEQYGRTETMIEAFQFNLSALSGIALLVGVFLIYNTVSISVAARRREIGMLQAVGAGRWRVAGLFLGEAVLICAVGCLLGLLLGQWLAAKAVQLTAQTVETFYIANVARTSAASLRLGPTEIALALGTAIPLSLIAAGVPALEAASIRPVEVIRGAKRLVTGFHPPLRQLLLACALLSAGAVLTQQDTIDGLPIWGFVAGLLIVLGGALLVPLVLWLACQLVRGPLAQVLPAFRVEGRLAASNLTGAIGRLSISVSALAVSLAMMVAIAVLVGSFRDTVVYWLGSTLSADLFVRPTMLTSSVAEGSMGRGAREALLQDPDVVSVGWITTRQMAYQDTRIRLAATSLEIINAHRHLAFKEPDDAWNEVAQAIGRDHVLVSESFSLRFDARPGQTVALPTRNGPHSFQVAAVYHDYSSNQGTVMVDAETYRRHFAESAEALVPSSLSIYLRGGADVDAVRARLANTVGNGRDLYFASNREVRREAMRIFDSTFAITYALEVIAIIIAGLGVISTLITLIYERQREIALLSIVGATRRQIRRMIIVEAVILGAVSQAVGVLIGMALAVILIFVVNVQSFGWTIQFHIPWWFLVHSTVIILAVTALCGLYPASRAANIEAMRVVREE